MSTAYIWGPLLAILLALFGYLIKVTVDQGDLKQKLATALLEIARVDEKHNVYCIEHGKTLERVPEIERKLDTLMGQTEVYFKQMDRYTMNTLHAPVHLERDTLSEKLVAGTLTCKEARRLVELCEEAIVDPDESPERRYAAMQMASRVESLIFKMRAEMKRGRASGHCT
jgi:hypothetical protein